MIKKSESSLNYLDFQDTMARYNTELLQLSRLESIDEGDLDRVYQAITESSAKTLNVERSSIWVYNSDCSAIICLDLFEASSGIHSSGLELRQSDYPVYFTFLTQQRTLSVDEAQTDPCSREFADGYLEPLNIFSMLDAPIMLKGKMVGVLCNEKVGQTRHWTLADQTFAASLADLIARSFTADEKVRALKQLAELNQNLEQLVKRRTMELEEHQARSAQVSKMASLGEMAGGIAHEINNPLAIINMQVKILQNFLRHGEIDPGHFGKSLQSISDTTLRISKIIRGLRFFARDSKLEEVASVKLQQLLDDTLAICQAKFRFYDCKIEIFAPEDISLDCQSVAISQVFLNLLNNSLDAIRETDSRWVRIECTKDETTLEVRFIDSGKGIPEECREKIMQPFFTTKPVGQGTGLGLRIIKGIVEQHSGKFFLDPASPNTTFVIQLPLRQPHKGAA